MRNIQVQSLPTTGDVSLTSQLITKDPVVPDPEVKTTTPRRRFTAKFAVHRVQIQRWKNEALAQLLGLFSGKKITGDCSLKKPKNGLDMGSTSNFFLEESSRPTLQK